MSDLLVRSQGPCLVLSLNRPDVHNALNLNLLTLLKHEFIKLITHPESYDLVIIEGNGPSFCAGADVREMKTLIQRIRQGKAEYSEAQAMNQAYGELLYLAEKLPQTVITIAKGSILGGGLGLIAISDYVFCHMDTRFGLPEAKLGLTPAQVAPFIIKKVGLSATRKLALCGTQMHADQALTTGLVDQIFSGDQELEQELNRMQTRIIKLAPKARAKTKALLLSLAFQQQGSEAINTLNTPMWTAEKAALSFVEDLKGDEFNQGSQALFSSNEPPWVSRWHKAQQES